MQTELIIVSEYCQKSRIDPSFIWMLEEGGLIDISIIEDEHYLYLSQLGRLEQYSRLYYDLSINIEGIDVIRNMLDRIETMQGKIDHLYSRLRVYESDDESDITEM